MTQYDPNKKYTWTPKDKFEFSGEQFGKILNAFRAVLSTPEAQRILRINDAHDELEKVFAEKIEQGIVKEIKDEN